MRGGRAGSSRSSNVVRRLYHFVRSVSDMARSGLPLDGRRGLRPPTRQPACDGVAGGPSDDKTAKPRTQPKKGETFTQRPERPREAAVPCARLMAVRRWSMQLAPDVPSMTARPGDVIALAPNVLSVRHWDRLMGGALYAASPRVDWASLLRKIARRGCAPVPEVPGPASRAGRHHRA